LGISETRRIDIIAILQKLKLPKHARVSAQIAETEDQDLRLV
jgi:hypothetical protein